MKMSLSCTKGLFLVACICCLRYRGTSAFRINWWKTTTTTPSEIHLGQDRRDDCKIGTCMEAENCSLPDFATLESNGNCGYGRAGTWVCCLSKTSLNVGDSNMDRSSDTGYLSRSTPASRTYGYPSEAETATEPSRIWDTTVNTVTGNPMRYMYNDYRWNGDDSSNHNWKNEYDTYDKPHHGSSASSNGGCKKGKCTKRRDCSSWDSKISQATGECGRRTGSDWVCCEGSGTSTNQGGRHSTTSSYDRRRSTTVVTRRTRTPTTTTTETPYRPNHGNAWKTTTSAPTRSTTEKPRESDGCIAGTCEKRENCNTRGSTALAPTGICSRRRMGQWVCCLRNKTESRVPQGVVTTRIPNRRVQGSTSTTKRSRLTTATPNLHSHSGCGLRQGYSGRSSRSRSNYEMHPDAELIDPNFPIWDNVVPNAAVVGGKEAEPFSWPWVAALFRQNSPGTNRFLCAGSLINDRYILSAAHVFTPKDVRNASSFVVMLGTHTGSESFGEYRVRAIHLHPEYERRFYYNDISLLELERPVSFNSYVFPVCLPASDSYCDDADLVGRNVTVTGWGDDAFGGKSSDVLKEATFPVVSRESCNSSYVQVASSKFPRGITEKMLCAGSPNGGKDACQGDSGGPLTLKEGKHWIQVGVVSFGYRCGDSQYPGVYTKVGHYVDWIRTNAKMHR